jgi:hypothetical protein
MRSVRWLSLHVSRTVRGYGLGIRVRDQVRVMVRFKVRVRVCVYVYGGIQLTFKYTIISIT